MKNAHEIKQAGKGNLQEEKLMAYLEGKLSAEEQHEVELWLAEEGMESDAIDGLTTLSQQDTKDAIHRLNHQLRNQLKNTKSKRKHLQTNRWSWLAIIIVLLVVALGYFILYCMQKGQ